jgi:predicted RNase H-like HicB family nuclease
MYSVKISRDETGAWTASVPSVPGCHTYGRSLRAAKRRIREALSLWVDDADKAELRFRLDLPPSIRHEIDQLIEARRRADAAARHAAVASRRTVRRLLERSGLSTRDAAELVGLSHQRVQQLLSDATDPRLQA